MLERVKIHQSSAMPFMLWAISEAANECGLSDRVVLYSIEDGVHSRKSLHRFGLAVDFDILNQTDEEMSRLNKSVRSKLNRHFDVINEGNHGHVEYDPKY